MEFLHATSLSCLSSDDHSSSGGTRPTNQISAYTTLIEAQLILSSLVYEIPPQASCQLPRGTTEDLLTVQIQQLSGSSISAPGWRSQQADDVCVYEPAISAFFRQLFPTQGNAVSATISLERRLILPRDSVRSSGAELIQISTQNASLRFTQGTCNKLPAIAIDVDASLEDKLSTQERHFSHYNGDTAYESLANVTLGVRSGSLQLRVTSALRNRMRVFTIGGTIELQLLDSSSPPATASSFTFRGTLSDLQLFLPTVRYCGTSPNPKLSGVYFPSDAMDVNVTVSGPCSAVLGRSDGDLVMSYASVPIQVDRLVDFGGVSLVSLLPKDAAATAAAASGLVILNTNQLWVPLNAQYAPGNVDDIMVELQLESEGDSDNDGVFVGVESNSLMASDQQQDVSTYFQTITRTRSSARGRSSLSNDSFCSLQVAHSSCLVFCVGCRRTCCWQEHVQSPKQPQLVDHSSSRRAACDVHHRAAAAGNCLLAARRCGHQCCVPNRL